MTVRGGDVWQLPGLCGAWKSFFENNKLQAFFCKNPPSPKCCCCFLKSRTIFSCASIATLNNISSFGNSPFSLPHQRMVSHGMSACTGADSQIFHPCCSGQGGPVEKPLGRESLKPRMPAAIDVVNQHLKLRQLSFFPSTSKDGVTWHVSLYWC